MTRAMPWVNALQACSLILCILMTVPAEFSRGLGIHAGAPISLIIHRGLCGSPSYTSYV